MRFISWSGVITLFLTLGMLTTGTLNSITSKFQDLRIVKGIGDGPPTAFEHPFLQTGIVFFGEFICMIAYLVTLTSVFHKLNSRVQGGLARPTKAPLLKSNSSYYESPENSPSSPVTEEQPKYPNPLIFLIPACFDLGATTMMNFGLFYTNTSVYQMISGIVVVFNALLAVIFLKQKLYLHHWLGIVLIVIGTGIVGVSSYINAEEDPTISRNPLLGNVLVLLAQILAASLSITEEKLFLSYSVEPLQVLGWEGFWGIGLTSVVLFSLYWMPGDDFHSRESAIYAFAQLSNDWRLLVATICQVFSIAIFNFFGISITKRISSTTRSVLESCRTLFVWIVSLAVGWETFQWLQLIGFAVLVSGMFLFNEVIQIPYYHKWYLKQKAARDHVD